jgi:hypothetical protein
VDAVRAQILNAFRTNTDRTVRVLNCSRRFIEADGSISVEVVPDFIHPSALGYPRATSMRCKR